MRDDMAAGAGTNAAANAIPTQSRLLWILLVALLVIVMVATMWKDWYVTGLAPNPVFYLLVPPFVRWSGLSWGRALATTVAAFIGDLIVTGTFVSVTGLSTPGS